ncbi:MAG: Uma2 family endonuclease [Gammaproteobacteria bacterium]
MATARESLHKYRLSVDDYHRMGDAGIFADGARVELIEGELIDMSPIGSRHAGTVKRLNNLLKQAVGEQAIVSVQDPVVLGQHSEPEPDLALLLPRDDFYTDSHPQAGDVLLIVEVAGSSLQGDLGVKVPLYARHGIPEVWVVDVESNQLSIFHTPTEHGYRHEHNTQRARPVALQQIPGVEIDLSSLFR